MIKSDEDILAENGWEIECLSPLEIRHPDGSFATTIAAKMVIRCLRDQSAADKHSAALTQIAAAAGIAKQACDGYMQATWAVVEKTANEALSCR